MSTINRKILDEKLKLERKVKKPLSSLFSGIEADVKKAIFRNGHIITGYEYADQIKDIISNHTINVQNVFKKIEKVNLLPDTTQMVTNISLRDVARKTVDDLTSIISDTTNRQIRQIYSIAGIKDVSEAERQLLIDHSIRAKFGPRPETIATSVTQTVAENTRLEVRKNDSHYKEWVSISDEKTREAHISANGQTVGIDENFIVGGEVLRFPGDMTQGASLANTINCRCTVIYTLQ